MDGYTKTKRTTLKRAHERGSYDRATVHAILDEALICHVAFLHEGTPAVIPTASGSPACIAVTLMDGLVLARSGFHSSINYRSVVIYGHARKVADDAEKLVTLKAFMEKIATGRWDELRAPNMQEMKGTTVLAFDLDEVSAKIRDGGVLDEPEDMNDPVWAGVVPVCRTFGAPEPDPQLAPGIALPAYLKGYKGPR